MATLRLTVPEGGPNCINPGNHVEPGEGAHAANDAYAWCCSIRPDGPGSTGRPVLATNPVRRGHRCSTRCPILPAVAIVAREKGVSKLLKKKLKGARHNSQVRLRGTPNPARANSHGALTLMREALLKLCAKQSLT